MELENNLQITVQSPDHRIPSRALTLNPNLTLHHLKHVFLPQTTPEHTLDSFYFTFNGKPLEDSSTLLNSRIPQFSTLTLQIRVSGGGGDGGATGAESRDCYLNMYAVKKPDKVDPNETRLSKWTTCSLSYEPIKHPCVIDRLGNVFNKEALVEALLGKKLPKEFRHIKGLKDMIPIHLSRIPGVEFEELKFQCPITSLQFNGKYKFFALKGCGHVLSAKALKEVKSSACLVCHREFSESDKIVINGSEEEVRVLREIMEMERGKAKKKAKNGGEEVCLDSSRLSGTKHVVDDKHGVDEKSVGLNAKVRSEGTNGKVANLCGDVNGMNGSLKRFKAGDRVPVNATKEVYASIFTSSKKSEFKETYMCRSLPLGRN